MNVQGKQFGGEAVFTGHMDGDFVAEAQVRLNSGKDASLYFRYLDPDHWYRARLQGAPAGAILLEKMHKGKLTTLDSAAAFPSDPDVLRVKCVGSALEVWYNPAGTPGAATLSATDGDIGWGGVALSGWDALFDNLKVGYDADDDDDLDGSDDVVIDEDFAAATVSPTHDDAGNLTKDADYAYVFDAWNNLVKVKAQNDADVVVGVYAYYADNRRASKVVSNRGELDGMTYFFYDGLREIEERNGSEQVTQQYVWGHEYLDQLLMIRGAGGTWFVHQDANWNVIALTTPGGDVAEEVQYQPYGLPQVRRHLAFGDADADGDVDSADNTARTNALTTYNRTFDADFDGDVSNTSGDADQLAWEASYNDPSANVTMVVANRSFSPTGNPFLFTGRRLDPETGLYFYRFRTYHPTLKTFLQRDPLGYVDSASLYQYVGGRPTGKLDPFGLLYMPDDGESNKINGIEFQPNRVSGDHWKPGSTEGVHIDCYVDGEHVGSIRPDGSVFQEKNNPKGLAKAQKVWKKALDKGEVPERILKKLRGYGVVISGLILSLISQAAGGVVLDTAAGLGTVAPLYQQLLQAILEGNLSRASNIAGQIYDKLIDEGLTHAALNWDWMWLNVLEPEISAEWKRIKEEMHQAELDRLEQQRKKEESRRQPNP